MSFRVVNTLPTRSRRRGRPQYSPHPSPPLHRWREPPDRARRDSV